MSQLKNLTAEEKIMNIKNLTAEDILNDDNASNWLKTTLRNLQGRDIADALNDAEVLVTVLNNDWRRQLESNAWDSITNSSYYQHHGE